MTAVFEELQRATFAAPQTCSNVHRGSGHHSVVTTHRYEQARDIVLEYLRLSRATHAVVFPTPRRAGELMARLRPRQCRCVSSKDPGLPLGVRALAVDRRRLPAGAPRHAGGGYPREPTA